MWEVSFFVVLNGYWYNNFLWKCDLLNKDFKRYGNGWNRYCRIDMINLMFINWIMIFFKI